MNITPASCDVSRLLLRDLARGQGHTQRAVIIRYYAPDGIYRVVWERVSRRRAIRRVFRDSAFLCKEWTEISREVIKIPWKIVQQYVAERRG